MTFNSSISLTFCFKGEKWSPYSAEAGVTEYAGGSENMRNNLRKVLAKLLWPFRLPLADLTYRQQKLLIHLETSLIVPLGLAFAMGKNFCATSHTGNSRSCL